MFIILVLDIYILVRRSKNLLYLEWYSPAKEHFLLSVFEVMWRNSRPQSSLKISRRESVPCIKRSRKSDRNGNKKIEHEQHNEMPARKQEMTKAKTTNINAALQFYGHPSTYVGSAGSDRDFRKC